jgi:tetratricopeptide (TPR) repeat protein
MVWSPETADLHNSLGIALAEKGRLDEAIPHFEKVVALDPANRDAHANLGRAYTAQKRLDQAIPHFEKALERNPGSAELHSQLGFALANRNRVAEAIPQLERALEISPGLVEARYYLGSALMMNGRRAEALAQWRQALRQDPDNLRVLNDTAWALATCAAPRFVTEPRPSPSPSTPQSSLPDANRRCSPPLPRPTPKPAASTERSNWRTAQSSSPPGKETRLWPLPCVPGWRSYRRRCRFGSRECRNIRELLRQSVLTVLCALGNLRHAGRALWNAVLELDSPLHPPLPGSTAGLAKQRLH